MAHDWTAWQTAITWRSCTCFLQWEAVGEDLNTGRTAVQCLARHRELQKRQEGAGKWSKAEQQRLLVSSVPFHANPCLPCAACATCCTCTASISSGAGAARLQTPCLPLQCRTPGLHRAAQNTMPMSCACTGHSKPAASSPKPAPAANNQSSSGRLLSPPEQHGLSSTHPTTEQQTSYRPLHNIPTLVLQAAVAKHGHNWQLVATEVGGGRQNEQCMHHYKNVLALGSARAKGQWSAQEDELLIKVLAGCGQCLRRMYQGALVGSGGRGRAVTA